MRSCVRVFFFQEIVCFPLLTCLNYGTLVKGMLPPPFTARSTFLLPPIGPARKSGNYTAAHRPSPETGQLHCRPSAQSGNRTEADLVYAHPPSPETSGTRKLANRCGVRFSPRQLVAVLTALGLGPLLGGGGKVYASFQVPSSAQVEQLLSEQLAEPADAGWATSISAAPAETLTEDYPPGIPGSDLGRGRYQLPWMVSYVSRTGRSQPSDSGGSPRRTNSGETWPCLSVAHRSLPEAMPVGFFSLDDPHDLPPPFPSRLFRPPRFV
jgi:hypothetical protein